MRARPVDRALGLAVAVTVLAACGAEDVEAEAQARVAVDGETTPNIIVVLLDDADVRDFAFHEPEGALALPTIEALAERGTVYEHFYASSPVCSPTRAALLTGQYPLRYGLDAVIRRGSRRALPLRAPMLASWLRDRGYATAHVGKWHLGTGRPELGPATRGFDHTVTTGVWRGYLRTGLRVDGVEQPLAPGQHLTAALTDRAIAFVRANAQRPFFLNVWFFTPHIPLDQVHP